MKFHTKGLGNYITNPVAEEYGIEYRISDDISFILRRAGGRNKAYDRSLAKYSRPFIYRIRNNTMSNEDFKKQILMPTFLDSIIVDWKGITDEDGREVAFSKEACKEFLETFPNLFDELIAVTTEAASFREQEKEDVADSLGES